jgi:3-carboxy-cis,cis-muconate cycloisomerase
MAQSEVAEVSESGEGRGGSSVMPHKSNPVAAISVRACAHRAPGLVATLFSAMEQEHERAAGAWHSEWPTLTELLRTVGSAAAWLQECLAGLQVDTERMAATVADAAAPQMAAAATDALAGSLGRGAAHELVAEAVRSARESGRALADVLAERSGLDPSALRTGPDVGEAGAQVDDVLATHRTLAEGKP